MLVACNQHLLKIDEHQQLLYSFACVGTYSITCAPGYWLLCSAALDCKAWNSRPDMGCWRLLGPFPFIGESLNLKINALNLCNISQVLQNLVFQWIHNQINWDVQLHWGVHNSRMRPRFNLPFPGPQEHGLDFSSLLLKPLRRLEPLAAMFQLLVSTCFQPRAHTCFSSPT